MSITPSAIHDTLDSRRALPIQLPHMPHCPEEWFSSKRGSPLTANEALIQRKLIYRLLPFERIAQDFIFDVLEKLSIPKTPYISIENLTLLFQHFGRLIKYGKLGKKSRPSLQQAALDMVEAVVEKVGFSLGEFKLIYCVASLKGVAGFMDHSEEIDSAETRELQEWLGKDWDGFNAVEHCVDIEKLSEILRRLLDYHIAVLQPSYRAWERWCDASTSGLGMTTEKR
jgi:hypothetical protein